MTQRNGEAKLYNRAMGTWGYDTGQRGPTDIGTAAGDSGTHLHKKRSPQSWTPLGGGGG